MMSAAAGVSSGVPQHTFPHGMFPEDIGGYKMGKVVGNGAMGTVFAAHLVSDPQRKVVLKRMAKVDKKSQRQPTYLELLIERRGKNEAQILRSFNLGDQTFRNRVVELHALFEAEKFYYSVLEPMDMNLYEFMKLNSSPLPEVVDIVKQICQGLEFIRPRNIVHNDLKPENILVKTISVLQKKRLLEVRLCDFDAAFLTTKELPSITAWKVTHLYRPPEISDSMQLRPHDDNDKRNYRQIMRPSMDIWSLGCIAYELRTGKVLIPDSDEHWKEKHQNFVDQMHSVAKNEDKLSLIPSLILDSENIALFAQDGLVLNTIDRVVGKIPREMIEGRRLAHFFRKTLRQNPPQPPPLKIKRDGEVLSPSEVELDARLSDFVIQCLQVDFRRRLSNPLAHPVFQIKGSERPLASSSAAAAVPVVSSSQITPIFPENIDGYEIDRDESGQPKVVGEGKLGKVFAAHLVLDPERNVVIKQTEKIYKKELTWFEFIVQRNVKNEVRILRSFNLGDQTFRNRVVEVHALFEDEKFYYSVLEPMDMNLRTFMKLSPSPLAEVVDIIKQICEGLEFIKPRGIVHCDLKPGNILVKITPGEQRRRLEVRLCDVDAAFLTTEPLPPPAEWKVTLGYRAPEISDSMVIYDYQEKDWQLYKQIMGPSIDIWSLGCIAFELRTGKKLIRIGEAWKQQSESLCTLLQGLKRWEKTPESTLKMIVEDALSLNAIDCVVQRIPDNIIQNKQLAYYFSQLFEKNPPQPLPLKIKRDGEVLSPPEVELDARLSDFVVQCLQVDFSKRLSDPFNHPLFC